MKTTAIVKTLNGSKLSYHERRIVTYLVSRKGIGYCFIKVKDQEFTRRYLAVRLLSKSGVIEVLNIKINVVSFRFAMGFETQRKLSIIAGLYFKI